MSEEQVSIIRLMDGSTVVGRVNHNPDTIEVEYPIELVFTTTPLRGILGEQVSLKPWMAIAQDQVFIIDRTNVITIGALDNNFIAGYERMVESIYFQETKWQGNLEGLPDLPDEDLVLDEDLDIDTLTELAEAVLKKQIH